MLLAHIVIRDFCDTGGHAVLGRIAQSCVNEPFKIGIVRETGGSCPDTTSRITGSKPT